ncbi:uncharacterized protein LOC134239155 [Saccostrea cucullata]|uniref:uncharacterized protein LOC134239155 n=1 Tax=Saccostrea cuccullata TaxID=36930 RepID=UPI002ED69F77
MEKEQILAVDAMMREIMNIGWTSSQVIRHLSQSGTITLEERKELLLLDKRPLRTKKILTIMKKKNGGFLALKRALMIEKVHNKHLVEKLEARYQKFLHNPVSANQKPKMKEKLSPTEVMHIFNRLTALVWGKNSKEINDTNFVEFDKVLDELESNRDLLYNDDRRDEFRSLFTLIMQVKEENRLHSESEKAMKDETKKLKRKLKDAEAKNADLEMEITDLHLSREDEVNRRIEEVRRRLLKSGLDDPDEDFFKGRKQEVEEDAVAVLDDKKSDDEDNFDENFTPEITDSSHFLQNRRQSFESSSSSIFINNHHPKSSQNVILIQNPRNVNIFS